jgi:hypothetical protein
MLEFWFDWRALSSTGWIMLLMGLILVMIYCKFFIKEHKYQAVQLIHEVLPVGQVQFVSELGFEVGTQSYILERLVSRCYRVVDQWYDFIELFILVFFDSELVQKLLEIDLLGLDGGRWGLDGGLIGFASESDADGLFFEDGGSGGFKFDGSGLESGMFRLGLWLVLFVCFFFDSLFKLLQDVESLELGMRGHKI